MKFEAAWFFCEVPLNATILVGYLQELVRFWDDVWDGSVSKVQDCIRLE